MDTKDPELLSITEVGEASGLQSSALRYYEKAGLISPATRVGGRRHYEAAVLERLSVVRLLRDTGFTIGEISELMNRKGKGRRWRSVAEAKLHEIDDHLDRVEAAKALLVAALECGCSGLESCDLVRDRRGRHQRTVQSVSLRMGPPTAEPHDRG